MNKKYLDRYYDTILFGEERGCSITLPMAVLYRALFGQSGQFLKESCDLSHAEMDVLTALWITDAPMSPTELYEATVLSSGGMTKVLVKLQDKKLIRRLPSREDKRSMLVQLNELGVQTAQKCIQSLAQQDQTLFGVLSQEEKDFLKKIMKKLAYASLTQNDERV